MPLKPITLPPGVYRNGTPYDAKNRYFDSNLIRWHDGALRPIGGWERRTDGSDTDIPPMFLDPSIETVRDCITYTDNDNQRRAVFGSNRELYALNSGAVGSTITPTGFTAGPNSATGLIGYGVGPYGTRTYGTPRNPADAMPVNALRWVFDTWGENVLAAPVNGPLYEYAPDAAEALAVANAPQQIAWFITTDERIVMTITNDGSDPRLVQWCDREDNTDWTPTDTNYAGFQRLQGTGLLLGIYKVQSEFLILSETDAHIGRFIGAPYVYGFDRIGEHCQPIHSHAVLATDRFAMWMGSRNFWVYDGTLKPVPCDVMDYIRETMDTQQVSKIWCMTVSDYSELWWFYQSYQADEIDTYVAYDYVERHWAIGKLARTTGVDKGAYRSPIMVTADGIIYNHEQSAIKAVGETYATTGPLELGDGDTNLAVRQVFPDTQSVGDVQYEFFTKQLPHGQERAFGPYPYAEPVNTTGVLGREVRMKITGLTNKWEVGGKTRFDIQPLAQKGYPIR